jgi:hypothetical protein
MSHLRATARPCRFPRRRICGIELLPELVGVLQQRQCERRPRAHTPQRTPRTQSERRSCFWNRDQQRERRFFGLVFVVPGVVGSDLSDSFAAFAAYADLATGALYMIPIIYVPLLLITHVAAFYMLVRPPASLAPTKAKKGGNPARALFSVWPILVRRFKAH